MTKVVFVNRLSAGSCVGYGCTHRLNVDTTVAVLPVGYYEGYNRLLSDRAYVLVGGKRARILGRVCMNMAMADVTHIANVKPGDDVVLLGSLENDRVSADLRGTISYEVVTGINGNLPRVVVE